MVNGARAETEDAVERDMRFAVQAIGVAIATIAALAALAFGGWTGRMNPSVILIALIVLFVGAGLTRAVLRIAGYRRPALEWIFPGLAGQAIIFLVACAWLYVDVLQPYNVIKWLLGVPVTVSLHGGLISGGTSPIGRAAIIVACILAAALYAWWISRLSGLTRSSSRVPMPARYTMYIVPAIVALLLGVPIGFSLINSSGGLL